MKQVLIKLASRPIESCTRVFTAVAISVMMSAPALGAVLGQGGPYQVKLTTDPAIIPIAKVNLHVEVTAGGQPVTGATIVTLVKMPTMNMGEKEVQATPVPGKPGHYMAPAIFSMAGQYTATLNITAQQGSGTVVIPLETGQDTGSSGAGPRSIVLWTFVAVGLLFVLYRVYKTGQKPNLKAVLNRSTVFGVVLLVAMYLAAAYAIKNWRREGAMTPIEAQAMEMNTPAPPGTLPVTLASVERGPMSKAVQYTGQAVGMNEQDVSARVQGWLTWMPLYVGDRVTAGQVIGRLDTSQVAPQIAERQAAVNMAAKGVDVMRREYRQALAEANQMRAEVAGKRDAVAGGQAELEAAREEKASAEAELASMRSMIADAEAELQAMKADQTFRQQELARMKQLLDRGAVSKAEYQEEVAMAAGADAKVRQAEARRTQVRAQVRAAEAGVRKAESMINAAEKKLRQMGSEVRAAEAAVRAAESMAEARQAKIGEAQAGVGQARAGLSAVTTTRGYSEVRAQISGVVTQRVVAPGTLVNPGQAIVRVAQVNPIRLQANVAEADLDAVRIGARVTVRVQGSEDRPLVAKVTSVTPAVDPVARTGVVEAVVPNPAGRIRPGQFVTMDIQTASRGSTLRVPNAAVSRRGADGGRGAFVWVAEPGGGQYTVRRAEVEVGVTDGKHTEVVSGLEEGQQVVLSGHEFLKGGDAVVAVNAPATTEPQDNLKVTVSAAGFTPASLNVQAGRPVKITFTRTDEKNCGDTILLPEYNIEAKLPLNQPVTVEFVPKKSGDVAFTCGMNMMKGKVVVQ